MYHAWQNMGEIGSNFGGSYMTDPLLLTVNRNCPMRRFLRKKTSFGYFCWETPRINMGFSRERKCLLNIVSQKLISYDFCTSFVLHKVKKGLRRFQVEAHDAYACKLILGLCHSPPRLENQSGSWKIENLVEEINNFISRWCPYPKTCWAGKKWMLLCDIHPCMWQKA